MGVTNETAIRTLSVVYTPDNLQLFENSVRKEKYISPSEFFSQTLSSLYFRLLTFSVYSIGGSTLESWIDGVCNLVWQEVFAKCKSTFTRTRPDALLH